MKKYVLKDQEYQVIRFNGLNHKEIVAMYGDSVINHSYEKLNNAATLSIVVVQEDIFGHMCLNGQKGDYFVRHEYDNRCVDVIHFEKIFSLKEKQEDLSDCLLKERDKLLENKIVTYPKANVIVNAPLALSQLSIYSRVHLIEQMLKLPLTTFPYVKQEE